jgi:protein-tyrosine phosphatase
MEEAEQKEEMNKNRIGEIVPGLWIGALWSIREISKRPTLKWTIISALHSQQLSTFIKASKKELETKIPGIIAAHELWEIPDKSDSVFISPRLEEVLTTIDQGMNTNENRVSLVHCAFGTSRSVSVCAAWLISRRRMSLSESLECIRHVRPEAMPNMGFIASLRALEQSEGSVQLACQRMADCKQKDECTHSSAH